mgnify:CR=1 FL=1|jgi:hypothetical protein
MVEEMRKVYAVKGSLYRSQDGGDDHHTFYIPADSTKEAREYFLEHIKKFRCDDVLGIKEVSSGVEGFEVRAMPKAIVDERMKTLEKLANELGVEILKKNEI